VKKEKSMTRSLPRNFGGACALLALMFACFVPAEAQFAGVLTQHNDTARTGQNLNETILTPQNVNFNTFGKLFSYTVDGQVYAQPLYVPNVTLPNGGGTHNIVYVETQNDSLYAFDADGLSPTALFQVSFINPAQGITPVSCETDGNTDISCGVYPIYGINSTPVIDPTTNTIYLVTRTDNNGTYYQTLHALDITTGAEKFGGPVNISGQVVGSGQGSEGGIIQWDPLRDVQRAGLLELNGVIYIGWAGAAHGWIMGYNATTLQQTAIFNTTPNAELGGVWAAGNGLVADASGNIYAAVGDATFDANTGGTDYGDSLLQLDAALNVEQYFTPMDQACRAINDLDLGSAGPMLFPSGSTTIPYELLIAGKGGTPCDKPAVTRMYVVNPSDMGGYKANRDADLQDVAGSAGGYWSSPAFWQGSLGTYIYSAGTAVNPNTGDYLKMLSVSDGTLAAYAQSPNRFPSGGTPAISANGNTNGIVWVIERPESLGAQPGAGAAVLYAYDAENLNSKGVMQPLYNSAEALSQSVFRDRGGCANKFAVPTIANGKVYVATQNELDVFGLLGSQTGPSVFLEDPCYTYAASDVGTPVTVEFPMVNSGNSKLTISSIQVTGNNAPDFVQTNNCPASLAAGKKCVITVTFTASLLGPEWAYVTITDNAVGSPHNMYLIGVGQSSGKSELAHKVVPSRQAQVR
jgi:hypothetical protein